MTPIDTIMALAETLAASSWLEYADSEKTLRAAIEQALKMEHLNYLGCMEDLKEAEKAQGEPVAWMYFDSDGDAIFGHPNGYRPSDAVPVYAAPQQREWVGLTDEEVQAFVGAAWSSEVTPAHGGLV